MTISITTAWEVRGQTGSDSSGGGFNPNNSNMAVDLAVVSGGNTSSPVVSSASFNFTNTSGLLFVKAGTNLTPGWYPIVSVASNQATLNAAVGAVVLYGAATILNTVAGISSTATQAAGGTWSIDYSQQASAQISYTDMVIGATTTQFTSAGNPVGKNLVGNIINVTAGTGFTAGRYEIVSTSGTTGTCDRSLGTASSTGGNASLGGALATVSGALSGGAIASNLFWIKADGTYNITASIAVSLSAGTPTNTSNRTRIIGYSTYRGDNGQVTVKANTNTGITMINVTGNYAIVQNFILNCNSLGTSTGISLAGSTGFAFNCAVQNFTTAGIAVSGAACLVKRCSVTGGTSAATAGINQTTGQGSIITECTIDSNSCSGIVTVTSSYVQIERCQVTRNTGSTSDGIVAVTGVRVTFCTIANNGRNGINDTGAYNNLDEFWKFNLIANNGAYGIASTNAYPSLESYDGNVFFNNNGNRSNVDNVATLFATAYYVKQYDVTVASDPFTNSSGGVFTLNATGAATVVVANPLGGPSIVAGCYGANASVIVVEDD